MEDLTVEVKIADLPMWEKRLLDLALGTSILRHLVTRIESANLSDLKDIAAEIRRAVAAIEGRDA